MSNQRPTRDLTKLRRPNGREVLVHQSSLRPSRQRTRNTPHYYSGGTRGGLRIPAGYYPDQFWLWAVVATDCNLADQPHHLQQDYTSTPSSSDSSQGATDGSPWGSGSGQTYVDQGSSGGSGWGDSNPTYVDSGSSGGSSWGDSGSSGGDSSGGSWGDS